MHQELDTSSTFIVIQDSPGLHDLAHKICGQKNIDLVLLHGTANGKSFIERTLIQRNNVKFLNNNTNIIFDNVFLFNDLRPESQVLLNKAKSDKNAGNFVCLEDGVALYAPRGVFGNRLYNTLKYKLAFDLNCRFNQHVGFHPAISEIRCFYPNLICQDLRETAIIKKLGAIIKGIFDEKLISGIYSRHYPNNPSCMICVPYHTLLNFSVRNDFLLTAIGYCKNHNLRPIFKIHPRDTRVSEILKMKFKEPDLYPSYLPMEFISLTDPNVISIIGSRTSALHITKALRPDIQVLYYEPDGYEKNMKWVRFFEAVHISSLEKHNHV